MSEAPTATAAPAPHAPPGVSPATIGALMLAPFAFGTSAFVFTGILEPMARDLGVSVAAAGQLQSAFAIACAVGGPVLARYTQRFERRSLLLAVVSALLATNILSALAPSFAPLAAARIAAGFLGALTLPICSAVAASLVTPEKRPGVLALVLLGQALSFIFGVPLGSVVGGAYGWAASFWFASAITAAALLGVFLFTEKTAAPPPPPPNAFRRVLTSGGAPILAVTLLSFTATFTTVAYVGPVVTRLTGLTGGSIGGLQTLVGIGGVAGLFVGARLATRFGAKPLVGLAAAVLATQLAFSGAMLGGLSGVAGGAALALVILVSAGALFAISPINQATLAARAGEAATVAFALNGSMIFLGQGLGAVIGGAVIAGEGLGYVGLAGAVAGLLAVAAATRAARL